MDFDNLGHGRPVRTLVASLVRSVDRMLRDSLRNRGSVQAGALSDLKHSTYFELGFSSNEYRLISAGNDLGTFAVTGFLSMVFTSAPTAVLM